MKNTINLSFAWPPRHLDSVAVEAATAAVVVPRNKLADLS